MHAKQKFVVVALGTIGDVHPFLGIAAALKERGHAVTFLTNGYFRETVSRAGVAFHPVGRIADYEAAVADPALWDSRRGFEVAWRSVAPAMKDIYGFVRDRASPECVIVAHPLATAGAGLAKEKLPGVNLVTVYLAPSNLRTCYDPLHMGPLRVPAWLPHWVRRWLWGRIDARLIDPAVLPGLNALRQDLGLAPIDNSIKYLHAAADRSITLFPDWFAKSQPDWPRTLRSADFVLFDSHRDTGLPEAVERFLQGGEPPIAFTPGSGMQQGAGFFRASLGACLRLNKRAIFLTRRADQIPDNLPPTVKWFEYVPFHALLRRAAALVHHGGIGSSAEAMRAGIPQLVMPMAHDQFDNAARIEALGVGLRIPRRNYTIRTAAQRLSALLESESVRAQCRKVAMRFADLHPLGSICQLIENTAQTAGSI